MSCFEKFQFYGLRSRVDVSWKSNVIYYVKMTWFFCQSLLQFSRNVCRFLWKRGKLGRSCTVILRFRESGIVLSGLRSKYKFYWHYQSVAFKIYYKVIFPRISWLRVIPSVNRIIDFCAHWKFVDPKQLSSYCFDFICREYDHRCIIAKTDGVAIKPLHWFPLPITSHRISLFFSQSSLSHHRSLYLPAWIIITMDGAGAWWQTALREILGILGIVARINYRPLTNEKSCCFKNNIYDARQYICLISF